MSCTEFEIMVIGGGLSGLVAAYILARAGTDVVLIDRSLPGAAGALGGFTSFSGAKFSLLPAGQGLVPVAGSVEILQKAIEEVLNLCGIEITQTHQNAVPADKPLSIGIDMRTYTSIVLNPYQVANLVQKISETVYAVAQVKDVEVREISRKSNRWHAFGKGKLIAHAPFAIYAGGRTGGSILRSAGATPQEGKGLDIGVRLEFSNSEALASLRSRGPDAKVLMDRTRTFCLNHPGIVYRYPFQNITIPGGIVAEHGHDSANVGLLTRVAGKEEALERILGHLSQLPAHVYESAQLVRGAPFQDKAAMIESAYGPEVAGELKAFADMLGREGLVDWRAEHRIHFPLLDWHWDVFATSLTHRTDLPGLYVAGDTAGHARGLLQAGISGWLAAHELMADAGV